MNPNVRPETMERITTPELAEAFIAEQVKAVQEQVYNTLYKGRQINAWAPWCAPGRTVTVILQCSACAPWISMR